MISVVAFKSLIVFQYNLVPEIYYSMEQRKKQLKHLGSLTVIPFYKKRTNSLPLSPQLELQTFQPAMLLKRPKEQMPREFRSGSSSHDQDITIRTIANKKITAY